MRLLLAEDEEAMSEAIVDILEYHRYQVDAVYDGGEALDYIHGAQYDGIILDIMMPVRSGLEVLRQIRSEGNHTPVLLLTAKAEIDDRVAGLDAGADDYLTKPFAMKELLARIRSMTRRRTQYTGEELCFGNITLNAERFELHAENAVRLSSKEFALMYLLMQNTSHPLDTSYILKHVWAGDENAGDETVWLYISYLRNKLSAVGADVTLEGSRGSSFVLSLKQGETS
jgi:DNA-binding response OmpR family regulator